MGRPLAKRFPNIQTMLTLLGGFELKNILEAYKTHDLTVAWHELPDSEIYTATTTRKNTILPKDSL